MVGAGGEDVVLLVAHGLNPVNPIGQVGLVAVGVDAVQPRVVVRGPVPVELQPGHEVGLAHHRGDGPAPLAVAGVVGDGDVVDQGGFKGLQPGGEVGVESPELKSPGGVFLQPQATFLKGPEIFAALVFGPAVQGSAVVDQVAEIPAQHRAVHVFGVFRIAGFEDVEPDQEAAQVGGRPADALGVSAVVDHLAGLCAVAQVRQAAVKEPHAVEKLKQRAEPGVEIAGVKQLQLPGGHQGGQRVGHMAHAGGIVPVHAVHQAGARIVVSLEIFPGDPRPVFLGLGQGAVAALAKKLGAPDFPRAGIHPPNDHAAAGKKDGDQEGKGRKDGPMAKKREHGRVNQRSSRWPGYPLRRPAPKGSEVSASHSPVRPEWRRNLPWAL